jgi:hypothetical protein
MLTYTYKTTNGGEEIINTRVRDVLGLGSQSFPLMNLNGTPVKLTRNGVTVTVSKVAGLYRMESKQDGVKYRESFSGGASGWILLLSGDYVELTDDVSTLEWEFVTNGGLLHRFSLTRDDKKSRTGDVAVKMEDGSASASAVDGAPKAAETAEAPKAIETAEAPKAAETAEAPKAAEATKPTETPKRIRPHPDVVARSQARSNAQEKFQADGAAALPGSNWGGLRPILKNVTFNQAAVDASAAAAAERADYFRRRREQMVADISGGAAGGSVEQSAQPVNVDADETQAVNAYADETQAVNAYANETQAVNAYADETQAVVIDDEVDQRYAVLTVTNAPSDVGVRLHSSYVLEKDYSIGRLPDCDMVLRDPGARYSRKAIVVKDNGDAGVTVEIHGINGVIVKSVGGKITHPGIVPSSEPTKVQVRFGDEFSIPRGGCDAADVGNHITFRVTKPM